MEKLAQAMPVELQQAAQHRVGDELQAAKVNSTLSVLTDKREKGGEMVVVEASRFDACFQGGEIKHTSVLRREKPRQMTMYRGGEKEVSKHQGEEKTE